MILHPTEIAKEISQYSFFENFDEDLLLQICTMMKCKSFAAGEDVVQEHKLNDKLYFLRTGSVEVILQNELITELTKTGEVLGEMSIISGYPAGATIRAKTAIDCFYVSAEDFNNVYPASKERFQFLLYKIYAHVLTERLSKTNEKAIRFEVANRELVKTKKDLEELSQAKLNAIAHDKLDPLREALHHVYKQTQHSDLPSPQIENIRETLKPFFKSDLAESAIAQKSVLLIDHDKKQQLIAKMAVGGTSVHLDIVLDEPQARAAIKVKKYDLIMCNVEFIPVLERIRAEGAEVDLVILTSAEMPEYFHIIRNLPYVKNIIARNQDDRIFAVRNVLTTITKIINSDIFGLEKYLAWGAKIRTHKIVSSSLREGLKLDMLAEFKRIGVRSSLLDRVQVATEEMLMNAIYDAPHDAQGVSLYNHLPRNTDVTLSPEQQGTLKYACDGVVLGVSVIDPFGSLKKEMIIEYLENCYSGKADVNENLQKAGAGRGLHQLIESSDLTIFNVNLKKRTEVICLFNIDNSLQKQNHQPTFHYFFY